MAVVWSRTINEKRFEVRRAGGSVRLYTDGVFHSQYNPANPVTGTVWNLLMLPGCFRPAGAIKRALVLGVGGGAVIRMLHQLIQPEQIIGIELDPTHLYVARRFFGVTQRRAKLVEADAEDWLCHYRGPKFDLIIDDLFGEMDGEPVRTVAVTQGWLDALSENLVDDGVLVMNFISTRTLLCANRTLHRTLPVRFASAFHLSLPGYENAVGAFVGQPMAARQLRQLLRASSSPCGTKLGRLPFRIRSLST
jgi:spermidine synthase